MEAASINKNSTELNLEKVILCINSDEKASDSESENVETGAFRDIKTKTRLGTNSIFVEGFEAIRAFPGRPILKNYDQVEKRIVNYSIMLKAHLTCAEQMSNLPREIVKNDKTVKFDKMYNGLFKKNLDVFEYNIYLDQNIPKDASTNQMKKAKQKMFKKYEKESKQYLRTRLFENPCIIKSEKCKYCNTEDFVTIYYDQLTDLFAIVNSKSNCLLDFGIATKVTYAEIFAYKSSGILKASKLCEEPNQQQADKSGKELEVYQEKYIIPYDDAIAILQAKYGSNSVAVENGEFSIQDWQSVKKIEHAVCFGIQPEDFGFSQNQAREINYGNGGLVAYVQKGKTLPSLDFVRAYQNAIKNFCENRNLSSKNNNSTFRGKPCVTFFNQDTRIIVVFDKETHLFITAYKLAERSVEEYLTNSSIGEKI